MVMFNSYVKLPEGRWVMKHFLVEIGTPNKFEVIGGGS